MKKGDIVNIKIKDSEFPNTGIAYIDGLKVKVEKAFKGQIVRAQIIKKKEKRIVAKVLEVIEKAPYEIEPECAHFHECGGCSLQTITYNQQVMMKGLEVKKILDSKGILVRDFQGIEGSPSNYGYRNKMEYTFGDESKDGKPSLGMHKQGSFMTVITTDECKLVHDDYNKILKTVLEYFNEKGYPFYNKKSHQGLQRNLIVRRGEKTKEILVNIVTTSQIGFDKEEFVKRLIECDLEGKITGIVHTINNGLADFVYCESIDILWGNDYYTEEILGFKFKVSPFSFFQTNSQSTEKLYSAVLDYMGRGHYENVFDLYCGTGTIGQIAATKAEHVFGIEIIEEAVKAANENAKLNNLDNCKFIAGDVFEKLDELEKEPDLIILDPPRVGVSKKALERIIEYNVKKIIYVSCNPKTLGENLVDLQEAGYRVEKLKVFDNFPNTPHMETVCLLEKNIL